MTQIKIKPLIGWTQWQNPYDVEKNEEAEEDRWDNDEIEEYEDCDEDCSCGGSQHQMKVVLTPMGAIPLPEHSCPHKVFNLWIAHTNFDITRKVFNIVEQTDGVETLDAFSRYRMRVGIGKMFDSKDTIRRINQNLYSALSPPTNEK